jgi:hypothetical protein
MRRSARTNKASGTRSHHSPRNSRGGGWQNEELSGLSGILSFLRVPFLATLSGLQEIRQAAQPDHAATSEWIDPEPSALRA